MWFWYTKFWFLRISRLGLQGGSAAQKIQKFWVVRFFLVELYHLNHLRQTPKILVTLYVELQIKAEEKSLADQLPLDRSLLKVVMGWTTFWIDDLDFSFRSHRIWSLLIYYKTLFWRCSTFAGFQSYKR